MNLTPEALSNDGLLFKAYRWTDNFKVQKEATTISKKGVDSSKEQKNAKKSKALKKKEELERRQRRLEKERIKEIGKKWKNWYF